MNLRAVLVSVLFFCLIIPISASAENKCVQSEGEAVIVSGDVPSAKAEASARAKWAAMEEVAGVEVKAQSIVQNMALVDDAVSKQVKGVVQSFKVIKEEKRDDVFYVKADVCIEPSKAKEATGTLAMNNSLAVFIPARKPKADGVSDEYIEANALSENLIGSLIEAGYKVTDIAPTDAMDAEAIEKAVKSGSFMSLRSLMYKFLSNILIIGSTDYTISTKKGQDIGYGMSMPFTNVTVRLNYRILSKGEGGKIEILSSGTADGKGLATQVEDAAAKGLKDVADKFIPVAVEKIGQHIKGAARRVLVKVQGVSNMSSTFEIKDAIQNIAWVTKVDEKGIGEFIVSYTENPIYLANSLEQKNVFKVQSFTPSTITVEYAP